MITKTLVFHHTDGTQSTVVVKQSQIKPIKAKIAACFYDETGKLRDEHLGEIVFFAADDRKLLHVSAKSLLPVVTIR